VLENTGVPLFSQNVSVHVNERYQWMERLARASHHGPTLLNQSCLCGMDTKVNFRVAVMSGEAAPPCPPTRPNPLFLLEAFYGITYLSRGK
jgi:hypothetical protein